jgi:hypothetical protein
LRSILENWRHEKHIPNLLRFESGASRPDLFLIDGVVKTAVTGLNTGDPIYFNTDRIYTYLPEFAWLAPINPETMLALLVHEAGHHLGMADHTRLDVLGYRVGQNILNKQRILMFEELYELGLVHTTAVFHVQLIQSLLSAELPDIKTAVLISDETEFINFTPALERMMVCPSQASVIGYRVHQAFWTGQFFRTIRPNVLPDDLDEAYAFRVEATLLCQLSDGRQVPYFWQRLIKLGYRMDQNFVYHFSRIWD